MKKVAVFENEYQLINTIFDTANYYFFNNAFQFDYFPSSQSLHPFDLIENYPIVIVDIDLSQRSEMDGYALLTKLNALENKPKIFILTGHSKVEKSLKERNLPSYPIINKPLAIKDLQDALTPLV